MDLDWHHEMLRYEQMMLEAEEEEGPRRRRSEDVKLNKDKEYL